MSRHAPVIELHPTRHRQPRQRRFSPTRSSRRIVSTLLFALAMFTALAPAAEAAAPPPQQNSCQQETFCAWADHDYQGRIHRTNSNNTTLEQCLALPAGLEASSFTNQTGRPVTVYQDPECSTNAEFQTYPHGSFAPHSHYVARAVKIWTH